MKTQNGLKSIQKDTEKYLATLTVSGKTIRNYRSDFNHFFLWLSLREESDIETNFGNDMFSEYLTYLYQTKTPERTINRRLTSLRHLSNSLEDQELLPIGFKLDAKKISVEILSHPLLGQTLAVAAVTLSVVLTLLAFGPLFNNRSQSNFLYLPENIGDTSVNYTITPKIISPKNSDGSYQITLTQSDMPSSSSQVASMNLESNNGSHPILSSSAVLPANNTSVTVSSPQINKNSAILVTPTSNTQNQVLYISSQADGYFTLSLNEAINSDIHFYWKAE